MANTVDTVHSIPRFNQESDDLGDLDDAVGGDMVSDDMPENMLEAMKNYANVKKSPEELYLSSIDLLIELLPGREEVIKQCNHLDQLANEIEVPIEELRTSLLRLQKKVIDERTKGIEDDLKQQAEEREKKEKEGDLGGKCSDSKGEDSSQDSTVANHALISMCKQMEEMVASLNSLHRKVDHLEKEVRSTKRNTEVLGEFQTRDTENLADKINKVEAASKSLMENSDSMRDQDRQNSSILLNIEQRIKTIELKVMQNRPEKKGVSFGETGGQVLGSGGAFKFSPELPVRSSGKDDEELPRLSQTVSYLSYGPGEKTPVLSKPGIEGELRKSMAGTSSPCPPTVDELTVKTLITAPTQTVQAYIFQFTKKPVGVVMVARLKKAAKEGGIKAVHELVEEIISG